jgi:hypothetical protein
MSSHHSCVRLKGNEPCKTRGGTLSWGCVLGLVPSALGTGGDGGIIEISDQKFRTLASKPDVLF